MQVSVLNGVNLNMLGRRDPDQYGTVTLARLETMIYGWARDLRVTVRCRQTNSEGEFIKWCHDAYDNTDSYANRDTNTGGGGAGHQPLDTYASSDR